MKRLVLMGLIAITLVLAACGSSENAQEVYQQAVEAGEKIESAEMNIVMNQVMEGDPEMGEMVMEMDMQAALTMEPLEMHQQGSMSMDVQEMPIDTEIEMYMTEDAIYMFESMSQTWLRMDSSMMPAELMEMEQDPADQLELLEGYLDDIEFVEEEDVYIYRFDGEGEEVTEFTDMLIEENLGEDTFADLGIDMNEMMEDVTIHSIFYEIHIDKETYDTTKAITNMDLEIAVDEEGNSMKVQQEMTAEYTGINTIDSIEVPQEVIDSAQEM